MGITKEQLKNTMISLKNYTDSKVSEQLPSVNIDDININEKAVDIDDLSYVEETGIIEDINDIKDALIIDANNKLLEYFFNSGESLKRIIGLSKKLFENINRKLATLIDSTLNNEYNISTLTETVNKLNSSITDINNMSKNNKYNIERIADEYVNKMRVLASTDMPLVYTKLYRKTMNDNYPGGSHGNFIYKNDLGLQPNEEIISAEILNAFSNSIESSSYIIKESDLLIIPDYSNLENGNAPNTIYFDIIHQSSNSIHLDHITFKVMIIRKRPDNDPKVPSTDFEYEDIY